MFIALEGESCIWSECSSISKFSVFLACPFFVQDSPYVSLRNVNIK